MNKRPKRMWMILIPVLLLSACGSQSHASAPAGPLPHASAPAGPPPHGAMTAARACNLVVDQARPGFFTGTEQVHLVLTTYAKGESVQSPGDESLTIPPQTLVWVVEVHAKAINWNHSVPPGYKPPAQPYTDFSVVLNARTGFVSDLSECTCWPKPLSKAGTLVSLPPDC
jgi:hypothetical protein